MNRKGNVPILLLFVVALVLVIFTLAVFVNFSRDFTTPSSHVNDMISEVDFSQQYILASARSMSQESIIQGGNIQENFVKLATARDLRIASLGNYFGKIRTHDFVFEKKGKGYVLEIKGLVLQSKNDVGGIIRHFDLLMEFDEQGGVAQGL